jgi:hypothetical protein
MTQVKQETVRFYHLEEYNSNYYYAMNKKTIKHSLFEIRKYFLENNTTYILLKILIGLILFGIPIFIFKKIINLNNTENSKTLTNYSSAAIPLIISITIFVIYVLALIIMKVCFLCKNRLYIILFKFI